MTVFDFLRVSNFYADDISIHITENNTDYPLNNKNDIPAHLKNKTVKEVETYTNIEDYSRTHLEVWITVE